MVEGVVACDLRGVMMVGDSHVRSGQQKVACQMDVVSTLDRSE